jgi:hypothetical protein
LRNARAAFEIGKIDNIESLIRPATQVGAVLLIARNTEAVQPSDIATIFNVSLELHAFRGPVRDVLQFRAHS